MEGNSQEVEKIFVTPHGGGPESEFDLLPSEMKIVEQPNDVLEVHDPLFEYPYKIGDRSYFTHPTVDDFIRLNWLRHGIHASARHLSNPERHETKIGAGRWSSMQHEIST